MSLQYQQPRDPGESVRNRWSQSLDGIFEQYQRSKQAGLVERDRQGSALLANGGIDPRQVTPEVYGQAEGPQVQGEHPLAGHVRAFLEKKKSAAAMASKIQGAEYDKTLSETDENKAQAEKLRRTQPEGSGPRTVNIKGVDYIETIGANGTPHYQPIPERQPTQSEFVARGYADKAQEASSSLDALLERGFNPSSIGTAAQSILPSAFQSQDVKALENAKNMFGNSIARRESGATIKDDEMARYNLMYFPTANDSKDILTKKTENRRIAVQNLKNEGRRAPSALGGNEKGGGKKVGRFHVESL